MNTVLWGGKIFNRQIFVIEWTDNCLSKNYVFLLKNRKMSYPNTPAWVGEMQTETQWQQLSALEQSLLTLLAADCSYTEIVQRIPKKGHPDQRYSEHYIAHKISNLYKKIGVRSKSGAVDWYHRYGLAEKASTVNAVNIPPELSKQTLPLSMPDASDQGQIGISAPAIVVAEKITPQHALLARFFATALNLPALLLFLWITFSLLFGAGLMWRALWAAPAQQPVTFDLDLSFLLSLVVGLYGLFQTQRLTGVTAPLFTRGLLALSIGALFWTVGQLLSSISELGDYDFITVAYFDISDFLAYIPHNVSTLFAACWISRSVGLFPWRQRLLYRGVAIWGVVNLATIYLFYRWELYHAQPLVKVLYDVCYPLTDSMAILLLTASLLAATPADSPRPPVRVKRFMQLLGGAVFTLWVADLLFGLTTSLPATNMLAYENNNGVDLFYYTTFLLQGVAFLYLQNLAPTVAEPPVATVTPSLLRFP